MFEYKVMADNFAKKWTKRAPPPELKRKCPRRVKTEVRRILIYSLDNMHKGIVLGTVFVYMWLSG